MIMFLVCYVYYILVRWSVDLKRSYYIYIKTSPNYVHIIGLQIDRLYISIYAVTHEFYFCSLFSTEFQQNFSYIMVVI